MDAERAEVAVVAALAADGEALLDPAERAAIDERLQALRAVRGGSDSKQIKQAMESLDATTQDFAARRMDVGIRQALAGHRLDEFK